MEQKDVSEWAGVREGEGADGASCGKAGLPVLISVMIALTWVKSSESFGNSAFSFSQCLIDWVLLPARISAVPASASAFMFFGSIFSACCVSAIGLPAKSPACTIT